MVKVDLITGFLGSGKTTFIRKYAKYLMNEGNNRDEDDLTEVTE